MKPKKSAYSGGWMWSLPLAEDAQGSQDAQGAQIQNEGILGIFDGQGHLGGGNGKAATVPEGTDGEVF
ncbi:MAG: hypothetical protein U1F35_05535 [Steroidobacteraceae bacterium]